MHVETGEDPGMTNQDFDEWMENTQGMAEYDQEHRGRPQPYPDTGEQRQGAPNTSTRAQIYRVRGWGRLVDELPPFMTSGNPGAPPPGRVFYQLGKSLS